MNRKIKIKGSLLSKDLDQVEVTTERAEEITVKTTKSSNQEKPEAKHLLGRHKLLSPWEGPFIITKVIGPGTYKLITEDRKEVNNTWHISQLRRFYA